MSDIVSATMTHSTPKAAHFIEADDHAHPAVSSTRALVSVVTEATMFDSGVDLFPAAIENTDGSEDIALVAAIPQPDETTGYAVVGVLFHKDGNPRTVEWALNIRNAVLGELDRLQAEDEAQRAAQAAEEHGPEALAALKAEEQDALDAQLDYDEEHEQQLLAAEYDHRATSETYVTDEDPA